MLVLDTADIAPAERLEAVNQAFNTVSMPTQVSRASNGGEVHARMEIWQLGSGVLFTAHPSGIRLSRDKARVRTYGITPRQWHELARTASPKSPTDPSDAQELIISRPAKASACHYDDCHLAGGDP